MIQNVSVLICSRERPQLLLETVRSVLAGDQVPAEIVVVDQSRAANLALASLSWRDSRLRYVHSDTSGLSRARNLAIQAASHEVIVIIDDDMFVERTWLASLVGALQAQGPMVVVTGSVLPDKTADVAGGFVPALATAKEAARFRGRLARDVLAGGHMAAFRQTLEAVGGFDERLGAGSAFPAADDNDLGYRLLESGYEIVYVPEAVVYHRAWRPKSEHLALRWRYGLGKGGFYAKHLTRSRGHMLERIARDIGRRALGIVGRVRRDPRGAVGDAIYSIGVISGVVEWSLGLRKIR